MSQENSGADSGGVRGVQSNLTLAQNFILMGNYA